LGTIERKKKKNNNMYLEAGSREVRCDMLVHSMNMGRLVLFGINDFHRMRRKQVRRGGKKYTTVYPIRDNDNEIFEYTIPKRV